MSGKYIQTWMDINWVRFDDCAKQKEISVDVVEAGMAGTDIMVATRENNLPRNVLMKPDMEVIRFMCNLYSTTES
jgi:hypothetical protein